MNQLFYYPKKETTGTRDPPSGYIRTSHQRSGDSKQRCELLILKKHTGYDSPVMSRINFQHCVSRDIRFGRRQELRTTSVDALVASAIATSLISRVATTSGTVIIAPSA